jgi:PDZ domain/C2 domain
LRLKRALAKNGATLAPKHCPTLRLIASILLIAVTGCPAVYPELATRLRSPAPGQVLEPPPPEDIRWMRVLSARIPERTRDGRTWDQVLSSLPDPYARVLANGKELFRTSVQTDTLEPTWPGGPSGNFRILPEDRLRVELWDSNAINDKPIGVREIGRPTEEQRAAGEIRVELEGGGALTLAFAPARAWIGLGLWYELRTGAVFISRTTPGSPAERAGILKGDQVIEIAGRDARSMSSGQVRSAFNAVPHTGLALTLKHATGATERVTVAEGPIYPTFDVFGAVE